MMARLILCTDCCPMCGEGHMKFPQQCLDDAHEQLIDAQLLGEECELYDDMCNYATFWELLPEGVEERPAQVTKDNK